MTRGYPLITCPGISGFVSRWDELVVDMERFQITNITRSASIKAAPLPLIVREIISLGGLVNYLKKELANPGAP